MKKIRIFVHPNKLNIDFGNLTTNLFDRQVKITKDCEFNEYNYLLNVMRQKIGNEIFIFDGINGEFQTEIFAIDKKSLTLKIIKKIKDFKVSSNLTLAFSLVKSGYLEKIASQATQLGVAKFQPLITKHSVVDKFNELRFYANVKEACEQCERNDIPQINNLKKIDEFLLSTKNSNCHFILADETSRDFNTLQTLNQLQTQNTFKTNQEIIVLVGPEGGFSQSEFEQFNSLNNLTTISLGKSILKVDTAVVATLALLQCVYN